MVVQPRKVAKSLPTKQLFEVRFMKLWLVIVDSSDHHAKTIWKDKGYDVHYILAALAGKLGQTISQLNLIAPIFRVSGL